MYNIKKSFHLSEPIWLSLYKCTIISMCTWVQSIYNNGKYTWIKFPKSYHFQIYWIFVLITLCKLDTVDCPLWQLLFSRIKIKLSIALYVQTNPCVQALGILEYVQVQKIYQSFKKFLIFSFKFTCGLIHLMFSF